MLISYVLENLGRNVPLTSSVSKTIERTRQELTQTLFLLQIDPSGRLIDKQHVRRGDPLAPLRERQERALKELTRKQMEILAEHAKKQMELVQKDQEQRRKLMDRLVRDLWQETPESLAEALQDNDPTTRWVAAQVIGAKRVHLEHDLINRLDDRQVEIREAAHQALVRVARGTDFGPTLTATPNQRAQAIERWRTWLAVQDAPAQGQDRSATGPVASTNPGSSTKPIPGQERVAPSDSTNLQAINLEAARLRKQLVEASPGKQVELIAMLQEGKGVAYTQALAAAIPQLTGDARGKARDALADRMARMNGETLRDKLRDDDLEVRRAAALACAMKEDRERIPDLIALLEDPEAPVERAARAALKALSGKDFGPEPSASRAERAEAVKAWKEWWKKQMK